MIRNVQLNDASINFKKLIMVNRETYTEAQKSVISNIETQMKDVLNDADFVVSSGAIQDTIELWCHPFSDNNGSSKHNSARHIGTYSEAHKFDIADYNKAVMGERKSLKAEALSIGTIFWVAVASLKKSTVNNLKSVKNLLQKGK